MSALRRPFRVTFQLFYDSIFSISLFTTFKGRSEGLFLHKEKTDIEKRSFSPFLCIFSISFFLNHNKIFFQNNTISFTKMICSPKVPPGHTWSQVDAGTVSTCGVNGTGRILCWGKQGPVPSGTSPSHIIVGEAINHH